MDEAYALSLSFSFSAFFSVQVFPHLLPSLLSVYE